MKIIPFGGDRGGFGTFVRMSEKPAWVKAVSLADLGVIGYDIGDIVMMEVELLLVLQADDS